MTGLWKESKWRCRSIRPIQNSDQLVLIYLYQPIVGSTAIGLYTTLAFQLPLHRAGVSELYPHSYLMKLLSVSLESLLDARDRLEGVGLLNTFECHDPEHGKFLEYELVPPLTPAKFFTSEVLHITLYNLLGRERYMAIKQFFLSPEQVPSYREKNLTRSFQEVFQSISPYDLARAAELEQETKWVYEIDQRSEKGKTPLIKEEDFSMIRMRLEPLVSPANWTKELERELSEICYLYQLDAWDLLKALQNPYVTRNGTIDVERLRSYVRSEYRLRFGGLPKLAKRNSLHLVKPPTKPLDSDSTPLSEEEKHFQQLKSMSPLELLSHYHGGAQIPESDLDLVEKLVRDYQLPPEVVNVLLDYVLIKYDRRLPRKLVEKIAGHWRRLGIKTVEEAREQCKKENWNETKAKKQYRSKLPKAVAQQLEAENEQQTETLSEEELAELRARIQAKIKLMDEKLSARMLAERKNLP
jgi:replication initiation and membrane attachment protein